MTALDTATADKLARICGMFGSEHLAERATAAAMADRLVKERGLSWFDVIAPSVGFPSTHTSPPASSTTVEAMIDEALANDDSLTIWEWGFLNGIRGRQLLTTKQLRKLQDIVARLRIERRAAA
jgi:hypothetical protein